MQDSQPKPSRRGFFFGAAATGVAAAAIVAMPSRETMDKAAEVQAPKPAPEKGGGYSLSAHVKHYYKTARI